MRLSILICSLFVFTCRLSQNPYFQVEGLHEVNKLKLYELNQTWEKRIFLLDDLHRDYVLKINQIDQIFENTVSAEKEIYLEFLRKFNKLAEKENLLINKLKNYYIYGIYLSKNLGSSALTGFVYKESQPIGGFIILDVNYFLNTTANLWITQKELSVFTKGDYNLEIKIEEPNEDTLENALDYILLHELGHIVSIAENFLPGFHERERDFNKKEFSKRDWISEKKSYWDEKIWKKDKIHFYSKGLLPIAEALNVYESLEQTPFPTLYAATNADDHFAESFVSYLHIFVKKKNWTLFIKTPQGIVKTFQNGIIKDRCKKEREFLRSYLDVLEKDSY